ncbi:MAG: S-layer homology domain-containing protein, partial [Clostridia bacterium]|nr:S-layer homology domain-containing protein [Clostridia bacterium]
GTYYRDAVEWAVGKGVTNGLDDTHFGPDFECTRAQMVTFLYRAANEPEPGSSLCPFEDVDEDAYYYKAVMWAYENGITKGTDENTFSPDDTVTRAQTVTFLYRTLGAKTETENPFIDVQEGAYYYDAVMWAYENGITKGTDEHTFSPDSDVTRAQIVTFLYRTYNEG